MISQKVFQNIFKNHAQKLLDNPRVPLVVKKAIRAIIKCRTVEMGYRIHMCEHCDYIGYTYCSCRNRHCPCCQSFAKEEWINNRLQELINTQYFHNVFTLPQELNQIVMNNKEKMYNILFKAVSDTLLELGWDKKHLGAQTGAILVLHTWSQKMLFHPHLHCIIPGGGLSSCGKWLKMKKDFFVHVKVLGKVFRGKYLEYFEKLFADGKISLPKDMEYLYNPACLRDFMDLLYKKDWYVYSKATFSGPQAVIEYLGRYTHRVAISSNRIIRYGGSDVTFSFRDNKDGGKQKEMTITGDEFVRRFLMHVLPSGFMKIRYIGILANRNKKIKVKTCQIATRTIESGILFAKKTKEELLKKMTNGKIFTCPCCGMDTYRLYGVDQSQIKNSS